MTPKDGEILQKQDLLYPELSYIVTGILFDVYNELGPGHQEKYYQKAVAVGLKNKKILYEEQYYVPMKYAGQTVGKYFLDFLIEGKIVLELKRGLYIPQKVIFQTKQYLTTLQLQLGMVAIFTGNGVVVKRVLNLY